MLLLNIQCLNARKMDDIFIDLQGFPNLFFMCLNETWSSEENIQLYKIENYSLISSYSRKICKGGGVAIWAKKCLKCKEININQFCRDKHIEICAISCNDFSDTIKNVIVLNLYRSPTGDINIFLQVLNDVLLYLYKPKTYFIVCGDFNLDSICMSQDFISFCSILEPFGILRVESWPTRVTERSLSTIDHIFTNFEDRGHTCVSENLVSDHNSVFFDFNLSTKSVFNKFSFYTRDFNDWAMGNFSSTLIRENWQHLFNSCDVNQAYAYFFNTLLYYFDKYFPVHKKYKHCLQNKNWLNADVCTSSSQLKKMHISVKMNPNLKPAYNIMKKEHKTLVETTKKEYYQGKILSSNNINKACWNVVSEISNKRKAFENINIKQNNILIEDPLSVANILNKFFQEVPINIHNKIKNQNIINPNLPNISENDQNFKNTQFLLCPYTETELYELLKIKLKNTHSAGADDFPNFLIRNCISSIIQPLTHLINVSFCTGQFPELLKVSKVLPLFKKLDKECAENYRPISIPSIFSKIFEYAFLNRLVQFLNDYKIISPSQHGFQNKKSTMTAIHAFYEKLIFMIDAGECPAGIFCDLSRAFDCVEHQTLLNLLLALGMRGTPLKWIESFLTNRKQFVNIQNINAKNSKVNIKSSTIGVDTGVPQGSVLGPVLFLLYINNLGGVDCEAFFSIFADDTSVLISQSTDESLQDKCNNVLFSLNNWFTQKFLHFNSEKTNYIRFHHSQKECSELDLKINDESINSSDSVKFLGLYIDSCLNWKVHCEKLISTINSQTFLIKNLRSVLTDKQLIQVYYANIESRIRYGIEFWGWSTFSPQVFIAQKQALRAITRVPSTFSCRALFKRYNLLTLPSLYIFQMCIFIYNNSDTLQKNCDIHNRDTRSKNNFHVPLSKSKLSYRSPNHLGPKVFNKLPEYIKMGNKNFNEFKCKLKTFLIDKCFYNVSDYLCD